MYPDRVCPECGSTFTPTKKNQIYDRAYCRTKASRKRQKSSPEVSIAIASIYAEMEKDYPMVTYSIYQLAKKIGQAASEEVLVVAFQAIKQGYKKGRDDEAAAKAKRSKSVKE